MELWREVWRENIVPQLNTKGLEALRLALLTDDPRLIQRYVVKGVSGVINKTVFNDIVGACAVGYAEWHGKDLTNCYDVVQAYLSVLCKPPIVGFTPWFDMTPRQEMRKALLPEVNLALAQREDSCLASEVDPILDNCCVI